MRTTGVWVAMTLLTAAAATAAATAWADDAGPGTPEQVVKHHFAAIAARDLDAIVGDYAEDAVLITAGGVVHGRDGVRATFAQLLRGPRPGARTAGSNGGGGAARAAGPQILVSHFTSTVGWLIWAQNPGKHNELRGVETYLVRDGKIELETVGTVAVHPASTALVKP